MDYEERTAWLYALNVAFTDEGGYSGEDAEFFLLWIGGVGTEGTFLGYLIDSIV